MLIAETDNFTLESHEAAEVSRTDGGPLVINPKVSSTGKLVCRQGVSIDRSSR